MGWQRFRSNNNKLFFFFVVTAIGAHGLIEKKTFQVLACLDRGVLVLMQLQVRSCHSDLKT
jgi:hypothetical protein